MAIPIRVAICDSSPTLRHGLKRIISTDPTIQTVVEVSSQEEILQNYIDTDMDIILADLEEDYSSGIDCLRKFRKARPDVKIIIFSSCDNTKLIIQSLEIGVQGFHNKNIEPEEIIKAIRTVHKGGKSLGPCINTALAANFSTSGRDKSLVLSNREEQVLKLIAKGKNNSDIADNLYISVRTVKFHINSIFSKLNVRNRTEAAATMWSKPGSS